MYKMELLFDFDADSYYFIILECGGVGIGGYK